MERNVTKQKELLSFVLLQPQVARLHGLDEIFAKNEAEFEISAATLLNLKTLNTTECIFGPPVA